MADYPSIEVDLTAKVAPATEHWKEIDALREEHRFFWNTYGPGYWVLTRYDDIREAFQHAGRLLQPLHRPDRPRARLPVPALVRRPAAAHASTAQLMNWWFAPAAVAEVRAARSRGSRVRRSSRWSPAGRADFCATFGDQFPVKVLPAVDRPATPATPTSSSRCVRRMSGAITGREEDVAQMMAAWGDIAAYWTSMLADRHAQPLDPDVDFVSHLCRSELDGAPLPDADIIDLMVTLTLGSLDTLKSQLGWCFYHLATHPDDRRRLLAEPDADPRRGRGVPARLPDRPHGAEGDQRRRLPRLPDAQGRHGHAHASSRPPGTRASSPTRTR